MKYVFFATMFAVSALINGCKKEVIVTKTETEINVISKTVAPTISLNIDKVINDSTITLKWSKFTREGFKQYNLVQSGKSYKDGTFQYNYEQKIIGDADSTSVTITNIPRSPNVAFYLTAVYTDSAKTKSTSAYITYTRPDAYLTTKVTDALIDKQANIIYLFENTPGVIQAYDYATGKPLKKLSLGISLGYSAINIFDGKTEIYTPTNDGWLYIIDAATLTVTNKILLGGENVASVAVGDNKIAVSATDRSVTYSYDNNVKVYDRRTMKTIARTAYYDNTRLLYLESSAAEFIDITFNIIPTQLTYFKINTEGKVISKFEDTYHGDHDLDPRIVRSFPTGKKFITGRYGAVYNSNLVFEGTIADYYSNTNYSDFAFNQAGNVVYCAETDKKTISATNYPEKTVIKTYHTMLQPLFLFEDEGTLIAVSTDNKYSYDGITFIEKIKL